MRFEAPYDNCDDAVIAWLVDEALRPGTRFHADLFAAGSAGDAPSEWEVEGMEAIADYVTQCAREVA